MIRCPPRFTITDPLLPYPTPVLSSISPRLGAILRPHRGRGTGEAFLERADHRARPDHDLLHGHAGNDRRLRQLVRAADDRRARYRSEEHTSELQSLMRISYAVFCLKKNSITTKPHFLHITRN